MEFQPVLSDFKIQTAVTIQNPTNISQCLTQKVIANGPLEQIIKNVIATSAEQTFKGFFPLPCYQHFKIPSFVLQYHNKINLFYWLNSG